MDDRDRVRDRALTVQAPVGVVVSPSDVVPVRDQEPAPVPHHGEACGNRELGIAEAQFQP
jgi:hypothetical protein